MPEKTQLVSKKTQLISDQKKNLSDDLIKKIVKACNIFSLSIILWKMLSGYKSKPFDECKQTDNKWIILRKYDSFWNSKYHKNIQFLEKNYNRFNNNKLIQDLFEKMFEYYPLKRIKAREIENHPWFTDMHGNSINEKLHSPDVYESELHSFYVENRAQVQVNKMKEKVNNIESLYSIQSNNRSDHDHVFNVGFSDTQPPNESSVVMPTLSEMVNQFKNHGINEKKAT